MKPFSRISSILRHGIRLPGGGWALFLCGCALLIGPGCGRRDIRTAVLDVPCLVEPLCGEILQDRLKGVPGIRTIETDPVRREVTFEYDSTMLALKNLEYKVSLSGFDTATMAANPDMKARLPAACRCGEPAPAAPVPHDPSG